LGEDQEPEAPRDEAGEGGVRLKPRPQIKRLYKRDLSHYRMQ
jgi:hypothetical protein